MTYAEKAIEKAYKAKNELAKEYNVSTSQIVWLGGANFIICLVDGREIQI